VLLTAICVTAAMPVAQIDAAAISVSGEPAQDETPASATQADSPVRRNTAIRHARARTVRPDARRSIVIPIFEAPNSRWNEVVPRLRRGPPRASVSIA
jgi:hypothetical protein